MINNDSGDKNMSVQQTILDQIKATDFWALGAWGAREYKAYGTTLAFRVNGTKLKRGWITIEYVEGQDLYTVEAVQYWKAERKVKKSVDMVYADMLVSVIDGIVG